MTSDRASSDVRIRGIVAFLCVFNLNEGSLGLDKGNHPTPPWSPTIPLHRGAPQFCENGCSSYNSVAYGGGREQRLTDTSNTLYVDSTIIGNYRL